MMRAENKNNSAYKTRPRCVSPELKKEVNLSIFLRFCFVYPLLCIRYLLQKVEHIANLQQVYSGERVDKE